MQLLPSPNLSTIVKHFLILESGANGMLNHRLFPDGNPGMVFHYGDPFIQSFENGAAPVKHPGSFVYGQISRFHNIISAGRIGMLVVVFEPYGAYSLLGIPAHELNDAIISLQHLWGREAVELEEQLLNAPGNMIRIGLVEKFLMHKLNKSIEPDPIMKKAIQAINRYHGLMPMTQLTTLLQSTERDLERKFRRQVGMSPKYFSGIIRLQHFIKLLQQPSPNENLTTIAYECGYYDQSHSIREFKKNVGITPRQYTAATNLLAVNFIQFLPPGQ
jgi:AraC-like DNA-binding protein